MENTNIGPEYLGILSHVSTHPGISYGKLGEVIYENSWHDPLYSHDYVISLMENLGLLTIKRNGLGNTQKDRWKVYVSPRPHAPEEERDFGCVKITYRGPSVALSVLGNEVCRSSSAPEIESLTASLEDATESLRGWLCDRGEE